jgi:hypothetical protein
MPNAHFIHGAFDSDGRRHIDWLAPYFEARGYTPITTFDYGWTGIISAALFNRRLAKMLAASVTPGDIGVGHSNGCHILKLAVELGAPFKELVFLNPALDRDAYIAPSVKRITVFHSPSELPTAIARYIPFHPWGDMGRVGYTGKDARFVNVNLESSKEYPAKGHTYFAHHRAAQELWGPVIASVVGDTWYD